MTTKHNLIDTQGHSINLFTEDSGETDLISLSDIAKYQNPDAPKDIIKNWMRNRNTLEFLRVWEKINNPDFDSSRADILISSSGANSFVMSPTKWIKETHASGIISKLGKFGGVYARTDIAFEFVSWVSAEFKLYIIQDYQQLKKAEAQSDHKEWMANRLLAKVNHRIETDAIKDYLIPPTLSQSQVGYTYASEADLINMALFGQTASQWRSENPEKPKSSNIRDDATMEQLLVLSNLQNIDAMYIRKGMSSDERAAELNAIAREQMKSLSDNSTKQRLADIKQLDKK